MGAETGKFMGSIFIRMIYRTCHWSASDDENENKENVVLTLKERTNDIKPNKKNTRNKTHTTCTETKFTLSLMGKLVLYVTFD